MAPEAAQTGAPNPPAYLEQAYWNVICRFATTEGSAEGLGPAIAKEVWEALLKVGRIDYERDYGETITSRTVLVIPLESA